MSYFILTSTEDGICVEGPWTETKLKEELKERVDDVDPEYHPEFLDHIPDIDTGCFCASENATIVIRGEIIVPEAIKVATEFKV